MKLLLVIDSLGTGGAQSQMVNLAIGLKKKGEDVTLLTYHSQSFFTNEIEKNDVKWIRLKKREKLGISVILNIINIQRIEKFDLICAFLFTPSFYILLCKLLGSRTKIVVSERTFEGMVSNFHKFITRKMYSKADAIVANSAHQERTLSKLLPEIQERISFIPNGVNSNKFKFENQKKVCSDLRLIGIGRVSVLKNPKVLIEALNVLYHHRGCTKIKVKWIGVRWDSMNGKNSYFEECRKLLTKYQIEQIWEWVGQVGNVEQYLWHSDVLIHASKGEGFPNVICESLATGTPVIASKVYDHSKFIIDYYNGFLFDPNSSLELVDKIFRYYNLSDKEKFAMRENARTTALKQFSNKKMIESYLKLFNKVLNKERFGELKER